MRPSTLAASSLLAAAAVAVAVPAAAQEYDRYAPPGVRQRALESPQDMAFEVRFGRYVPNADDGLSSTPYQDTFGDDTRFYGGIELDWQALRIPYFGTLGPGFGIGYTRSTADAPLASGMGRSGQTTSLSILPMYLVGVVRADVIARETPVPLVPYLKLGVGYALWWASDADDTAEVDGVEGKGRSYGSQFGLGIMLLLDALNMDDARTADAAMGLNHSYLFAEWAVNKLDGFGDDHLQVGTDSWVLGLAFEF